MTIVEDRRAITGGVDTHADVHVAAALDAMGGLLGVREFPATAAGYASLLGWLGGFLWPLPAHRALLSLYGVGPGTAALLLIAAGDHSGRLRSEAAWAHLCAVAPSRPRRARPAGTALLVSAGVCRGRRR